jgi:UPF0716 protein FxsA
VLYRLLLLVIVLPLVELTLLVWMGIWSDSALVPVLFVLLTGIAGSWLARRQGYGVYRRMQAEVSAGRTPTDAMLDGALVFVAGVLMVLPGVLTDLVGISLLIPPIRAFCRRRILARFRGNFTVVQIRDEAPAARRDQVIDSYVVEKRLPEPDDRD